MRPDEQQLYQAWFDRRRPLLEAKQWSEAIQDVPCLRDLQPAVPHALSKPLHEASVALVTSAAITQPGQLRMDGPNIEDDYSIRLLDVGTPTADLRTWHTHFDTAAAEADMNVVYPIDRLKELVADGVIGRVASPAVSLWVISVTCSASATRWRRRSWTRCSAAVPMQRCWCRFDRAVTSPVDLSLAPWKTPGYRRSKSRRTAVQPASSCRRACCLRHTSAARTWARLVPPISGVRSSWQRCSFWRLLASRSRPLTQPATAAA